jgi:hypothetical protein
MEIETSEKNDAFWKNQKQKFDEGWDAYFNEIDKEKCPYIKFSSDYVAWNDGYNSARIDDLSPSCGCCRFYGENNVL